jgi:peptidyl-prolyl cis-trans isomerase SurA
LNYIRFVILFLLILCFRSGASGAPREVIDRIVTIVGDEIILASELAGQMQLASLQSGKAPRNEAEAEALRDQILDGMVSDRLFLFTAKTDTSIHVRAEEVEQALDEHIARMKENFNSESEFEEALVAEGLTVRELRRRFRSEVENQLIKQRLIQSKLFGVSVSRHEVEEFFKEFKDSIPVQPEALKIAHILLPIKSSQQLEDSVKAFADELRLKAIAGTDFAELSAQFSSFGAGANGGDLGFISHSDVVPEFARAAFNLSPGDISGVVKTQFGYHIIKCEDKDGEKLKLRHILLGIIPSQSDSTRTLMLADSLLIVIKNGGSFEELAKLFSDDNDTRPQGGELGWFASDKFPKEFSQELSGWKTPGEIKGPIKSQFGAHLVKLLDYQPSKEYSLEEDYDKLKEFARQDKTGKIVDEWIKDIKKKTFIEFHLENL